MADLNELLSRAAQEAEALAAGAALAAEGAARLLEQATSLGERVETEEEEARRRFAELERQLRDNSQHVRQEAAAALAALRSSQARETTLRTHAEELLVRVHSELAQLRAEKERVLTEVEERAHTTEAELAAYADRVRQLESAAEARLEAARASVAALREQATAARTALHERQAILLAELQVLEMGARERVDRLVKAFETLGEALQVQARDLVDGLHALSQRAAEGMREKFAREALARLGESAERLKQAIKEVEVFAGEEQGALNRTFEMLSDMMKEMHDAQMAMSRNLR